MHEQRVKQRDDLQHPARQLICFGPQLEKTSENKSLTLHGRCTLC
ncbi:MAG: hypothetical protein ACTSWN_01120 [Promethearchaeota archaeon]